MKEFHLIKSKEKCVNYEDIIFCYYSIENCLLKEEIGEISHDIFTKMNTCILSKYSELLHEEEIKSIKSQHIITSINKDNKLYKKEISKKIDDLILSKKTLADRFHPLIDERVDYLIDIYNSLVLENLIDFDFQLGNKYKKNTTSIKDECLLKIFNNLYEKIGIDFGTDSISIKTIKTNIAYLNKYYNVLVFQDLHAKIREYYDYNNKKALGREFFKLVPKENMNFYLSLSEEKTYEGINPYFLLLCGKFLLYIQDLDFNFLEKIYNIFDKYSEEQYEKVKQIVQHNINEQFSSLQYPKLELSRMDILN